MKIVGAFILSIVLGGASTSCAQQIHDAKKDRAVLNGYLAALSKRSIPYFYGLYVDNYLSILDASDSITIKKFLSTPNDWSDERSILIARLPDLERLNNVKDTVLVYGPYSMAPYIRGYVPPPQPRRIAYNRLSLLRWFGQTWVNSVGFSPSRVAYGRWSMPYSIRSVEGNPNALPYYMTHTNTNKYLQPFDR